MGTNGIIAIRYVEGINLPELRRELEQVDSETTVELEEVYSDGQYILIENLDRWFSNSYPRGCWPRIKNLIEVVMKYSDQVYYYPDTRDFVKPEDLVTPGKLKLLDEVWGAN